MAVAEFLMHEKLHSQLQEAFGLGTSAELGAWLDALTRGDNVVCAKLAPGLQKLIAAIDASYHQGLATPTQPSREPAARAAELAATRIQLQVVQGRLDSLSRIASDFYWEMDSQYRFTRVSEGIAATTGRDIQSLLGKTRWEAFNDPDNDAVWREHIPALDARETFRELEFLIRTPGREDVYVSASGEPMFDDNGVFTGYRGIANNVTARVRAQRRLRETVQLTEALLEAVPVAISIKDRDLRFTHLNAAYERLLERPRALALGHTSRAVRGEVADAGARLEASILENPRIEQYEQLRKLPSGREVQLLVTKGPVLDAERKVFAIVSTYTNFTELKRTQQQLAAQLRMTNILLDASPTPMVIKNRDLQITLVNSAYERMFGTTREKVLNKRVSHQAVPLMSEIERIERDLLANPGVQQSERKLPLPNGAKVDCIITQSTYSTKVGEVSGIITTFTDITDLKHTEANLIRARQQAEAAMHARSQFLANMSHEIRTPMNGVLGMASLLSATALNDEQREFVGTIQASGESLLKILNDILDFSKIEAGKIDIETTPFDVHSRLTGIMQLFAASAREKSLTIKHEIAPNVPKIVRGDPVRVAQALSNLIGNAIKFTSSGSVTARLSVAARDDAALTLRFDVLDTGIGIAPEALENIFEPFSQADESTTRRFGGTGLGLSISRQLIELMGGKLIVTSRPGKGSCFSFSVKVEVDASGAPVADASAKAVAAATKTAASARVLDILLAEDNLVNQTVATAMLKKLGCTITLAKNGREAIEATKAQHFDLVLMDCHMPEVDGFEATIEIRSLEQAGQARHVIVAQTANAMEGDRESCLAAGMDDYISKPFSTEKLAALIERWRIIK
ncbi:MAG: PAS domain S-box protein [Betaproteobacteria bacterium]|nr:PAS domain S-box protein [Betaproteobacteria bacterium]